MNDEEFQQLCRTELTKYHKHVGSALAKLKPKVNQPHSGLRDHDHDRPALELLGSLSSRYHSARCAHRRANSHLRSIHLVRSLFRELLWLVTNILCFSTFFLFFAAGVTSQTSVSEAILKVLLLEIARRGLGSSIAFLLPSPLPPVLATRTVLIAPTTIAAGTD
jgi:hypothetical protein